MRRHWCRKHNVGGAELLFAERLPFLSQKVQRRGHRYQAECKQRVQNGHVVPAVDREEVILVLFDSIRQISDPADPWGDRLVCAVTLCGSTCGEFVGNRFRGIGLDLFNDLVGRGIDDVHHEPVLLAAFRN